MPTDVPGANHPTPVRVPPVVRDPTEPNVGLPVPDNTDSSVPSETPPLLVSPGGTPPSDGTSSDETSSDERSQDVSIQDSSLDIGDF